MQKIFRFKTLKHQKTRDVSCGRLLRKPVVFYNRQKQRTQIAWMEVTTAVLILMLFWDSLAHAVTFEDEMKKVNELAYGTGTQLGIGVASIISGVIAIVRQSPGVGVGIMGLGGLLSFYLRYVKTNKFGAE